MYTVGLESDTRAYFTGVTILISLPTGTKIFNWLCTYLGNPPSLHLRISSVFFSHIFLLMFTIGGSTGIILGNHDTYVQLTIRDSTQNIGAPSAGQSNKDGMPTELENKALAASLSGEWS